MSEWVSHLRLVHCNDSDFKIVCGINGCAKTYQKCSSFLSHVYRSHRESIIQAKNPTATSPNSLFSGVSVQADVPNEYDTLLDMSGTLTDDTTSTATSDLLQHTVHQLLGTDKIEQKRKSALFILYLKEVKSLSETAIQTVISGCQNMLDYNIKRIQAGVNERLCKCGLDPQDLKLDEVFSMSDPFDGLQTIYMQEKFYYENFGCIVS